MTFLGRDVADTATRARALRHLHQPGVPVILANAWDAMSARAVESAGFPAVATSSAAVAGSLGFGDGEQAPAQEMLTAAARIVRSVDLPVTVDVEAGYHLPAELLVERLVAIGAAGFNLEDSLHSDPGAAPANGTGAGSLVPVEDQVRRITELRAAADATGVPLVINARTDGYLLEAHDQAGRDPDDLLADTVARCVAYLDAGADCAFPILADGEDTVRVILDGVGGRHLNVLCHPGSPAPREVASWGISRISYGGLLFRRAEERLRRLLDTVLLGVEPI
jgi:2-methylisocitrate lyase-like PEP mutase family enzyme